MFQESLQNLSESAILPYGSSLSGFSYTIPQISALYSQPDIYYHPLPWPSNNYDFDHPQLAMGDASSSDQVDLTYKFIKDRAVANYHLAVQLHQYYENWSLLSSIDDIDPPYQDMEFDPNPQVHGQAIVVHRGGSTANLMALRLSRHLGDTYCNPGYIVDKAAPDTAPATVNDGLPDWNVAVQTTKQAKQANGNYSTDALISPASAVELFDSQNVQADAEYWGMSSWTLVKKIYWRHYTWKGEQYGSLGYIGPAATLTQQVISQPEFHMYTNNSLPPPPPPTAR